MFSPELNKLIEASITDGIITDKELEVIRRHALLEGVDPDEVEVFLQAKLQEKQQNATRAKAANVKKCPICGAIMSSLQTKCAQCGHEITNMQAGSAMMNLSKMLNAAKEDNKPTVIKSFPVPRGKEDLLEFIISMQSSWRNTDSMDDDLKYAYKAKYDESIAKARIWFPGDPAFQPLFKQADRDNRWWVKVRHNPAFHILAPMLFLLLIAIIAYIFEKF